MENTHKEDQEKKAQPKIVTPIPEHYKGAVPYIYCNMAEAALDFYKKAFGARVLVSIKDDKGRIAHSELEIGNARIMVSDEFPEMEIYGPRHLGGTTVGINLFFEDADKTFKQALAAGAKEIRKVEDQFCGDREGKIEDPFGHQWFISTHIKDMNYDEIQKRGDELFKKH